MEHSSSILFILFFLVPIGIIIFIAVKKKKNTYNTTPTKQKRDEVWKSIKYFLKQHNEQGKEIIDSYVAKRKTQDFSEWKKQNLALWNNMSSAQRQEKKNEFKKHPKELYVVVFTTRDSKTKQEDQPRAIECEIIYAKTQNQREKDSRNIVINGQLDYAKEAEWIDPLRKKDEAKLIKEEKRQAKREQKRAEKIQKKVAKNRVNPK